MSKRGFKILFLILILILITSCAPGNPYAGTESASGNIAGFGEGFFNGAFILISFLVSLFDPSVGLYAVHNTGLGYNFGFILGLVLLGIGIK